MSDEGADDGSQGAEEEMDADLALDLDAAEAIQCLAGGRRHPPDSPPLRARGRRGPLPGHGGRPRGRGGRRGARGRGAPARGAPGSTEQLAAPRLPRRQRTGWAAGGQGFGEEPYDDYEGGDSPQQYDEPGEGGGEEEAAFEESAAWAEDGEDGSGRLPAEEEARRASKRRRGEEPDMDAPPRPAELRAELLSRPQGGYPAAGATHPQQLPPPGKQVSPASSGAAPSRSLAVLVPPAARPRPPPQQLPASFPAGLGGPRAALPPRGAPWAPRPAQAPQPAQPRCQAEGTPPVPALPAAQLRSLDHLPAEWSAPASEPPSPAVPHGGAAASPPLLPPPASQARPRCRLRSERMSHSCAQCMHALSSCGPPKWAWLEAHKPRGSPAPVLARCAGRPGVRGVAGDLGGGGRGRRRAAREGPRRRAAAGAVPQRPGARRGRPARAAAAGVQPRGGHLAPGVPI